MHSDCEPQQSNETDIIVSKLKRFNISSLNHTFENYKVRPGNREAYETLKAIGEGSSSLKFVLIYGGTGNGKTFLLEATVIAWAKRGIASRYQTVSDIAMMLKSSMSPHHIPPYEIMFRNICEHERLILDDFGMGTVESVWEQSTLEDIINRRYHMRYYPYPMVTLMATNKDISELPDRIVSRFYDPEFGKVILNKEGDYRKGGAHGN